MMMVMATGQGSMPFQDMNERHWFADGFDSSISFSLQCFALHPFGGKSLHFASINGPCISGSNNKNYLHFQPLSPDWLMYPAVPGWIGLVFFHSVPAYNVRTPASANTPDGEHNFSHILQTFWSAVQDGKLERHKRPISTSIFNDCPPFRICKAG